MDRCSNGGRLCRSVLLMVFQGSRSKAGCTFSQTAAVASLTSRLRSRSERRKLAMGFMDNQSGSLVAIPACGEAEKSMLAMRPLVMSRECWCTMGSPVPRAVPTEMGRLAVRFSSSSLSRPDV